MAKDDFSDAALVLIGHGSTRNAESTAPTYQHAHELRRRGLFAQVLEAFWKLEPRIAGVLDAVKAPRVFCVPLFISEGYFTGEIIPRELRLCEKGQKDFRRVQARGAQTLYYGGPVGTHPSMTGVILARAREILEMHPAPQPVQASEIALFVAGHGTTQNENSRQAIERHVASIRSRHLFAEAHAVFIEEEPRVGDCYRMTPAKTLIMVPFFISDGLHSDEDIPVLLGAPKASVRECLKNGRPTWRNPTERNGKRLWYTASVGSEPHVADVILERVRELA